MKWSNVISEQRVILFVFIIVLLMLSPNVQGGDKVVLSEATKIDFRIMLTKNLFLPSEDIKIKVIFENISDKDTFINTAFNFIDEETRLDFEIKMPNGKHALKKDVLIGKRPLLNEKDFYLLKKGEKYQTELFIKKMYDVNVLGNYEIVASYFNKNDGKTINLKPFWKIWGKNPRVWTGNLFSNKLTFKIEKE